MAEPGNWTAASANAALPRKVWAHASVATLLLTRTIGDNSTNNKTKTTDYKRLGIDCNKKESALSIYILVAQLAGKKKKESP